MAKKVVCFGEIMLRLAPPGYQRFEQAHSFEAVYGGGEANVALSIANYGEEGVFVTRVPDNPIGQAAINEMRRYGVNIRQDLLPGTADPLDEDDTCRSPGRPEQLNNCRKERYLNFHNADCTKS